MREIVWVVGIVCVVWSGWWAVGSYGLRGSLAAWLDARRAEGWQAEAAAIEPGGFPRFLTATMRDLAVADPGTGVAVTADTLVVQARALWPGDVAVFLPETPIAIATPVGRSRLTMQDSVMVIELHPGTSGEVETVGWTSADWGLADASGSLASGEAFRLTMFQGSDPDTYRLGFAAPGFRPGEGPRAALGIPDDWPLTFDRLEALMDVTFDRPWDRRALEERRPQPRTIKLSLAEAAWADLRLRLAADLTVDEAGVPEGTVGIQAENWRTMLDLAQAVGLLPPALRDNADRILQVLAGLNGNPETIDVQLNLKGGFVAVGFVPVGPAPRIVLR